MLVDKDRSLEKSRISGKLKVSKIGRCCSVRVFATPVSLRVCSSLCSLSPGMLSNHLILCRPHLSVQFSSVTHACLTLCDPMNHSTLCLRVHRQLPEFTQTYVHRVCDSIQSSHPVTPFSFCHQFFPASAYFPVSWLSASGGQSIRVSASASVLPMNLQD